MNPRFVHILETITYPELDPGAESIPHLAADLSKKTAIFVYKQHQPVLWVTILGGTGTGKSTLFNAICGRPISPKNTECINPCCRVGLAGDAGGYNRSYRAFKERNKGPAQRFF